MVSAKLLAEVDVKLRSVVRDIGTQKLQHGRSRPFGGLNVLMCGDFWQLDPPDGGFLGSIPTEFIHKARKYDPSPTIAHGQALIWGGPEGGLQGVTELATCERCTDPWLREVQSQIRNGNMSKDNHAFLHGLPTSVPGSWVEGDVSCGNATCRNLVGAGQKRARAGSSAPFKRIMQKECVTWQQERKSKALVAHTAADKKSLPME